MIHSLLFWFAYLMTKSNDINDGAEEVTWLGLFVLYKCAKALK